ncbi:MAG: long-chain fatty acid--CoA ligase [Chlamydiales bacterium]|nr:long-chain fatty acid--CoA ligase [Chlamydiia bacterium]MCP5508778.1 long-chain fatty acid--CoA ligase [Chlamydiales bacterium]
MGPFKTMADVIDHIQANYTCSEVLNYQRNGGWETLSTQEFVDEVKYLTLGLRLLGVKKGDKVGILAGSSPRWTIADIAIIMAGGITVPLFATISNENFVYEVNQTNIKTLFIAGEEQWEMFGKHSDLFDNAISLYDSSNDHKAYTYDEIIEQGKGLDEREPELYTLLKQEQDTNDLASIVYTSGSTGVPKGVMLSQYNLVGMLHSDPFGWNRHKDRYLNLLPTAHIFARALNLIMVSWGIPVYYVSDISRTGDACREVKPTLAIVVPRILEKIYAKMVANVHEAPFLKRTIGQWAFDLANADNHDGVMKQMQRTVADKLVYSHLRDALGGQFRLIISGGAALNPHLNHFFNYVGIPIYEGWGLTEAATVTCNRFANNKIGTIGLPFEQMEVKIGDHEEILVRGPIVMTGYYKNPEATAQTLDAEGWLHTGDRGAIDADGFVKIYGRIKELYKTSTGEYIAPVPIEQQLCKSHLIDMAMVVADGKKFASCLLFPDFDVLKKMKKAHGKERMSDEDFLHSDYIKKEMRKILKDLNKNLNHWEEIVEYRFVPNAPSIEGGELTPTMKIRREVVLKKYHDLIQSMYPEEAA